MSHTKYSPFLVSVVAVSLLFGCRNENGAGDVIMVPQHEKIPYVDEDHLVVDKTNPEDRTRALIDVGTLPNAETLPEAVRNIHAYLLHPEAFEVDTLALQVGDRVRVSTVEDGRLLVLDVDRNELIEYRPGTHEATVAAGAGEGPGELAFSKDLATRGASVFVARSDGKVTAYDCSAGPCAYVKTIDLAMEAAAVAVVGPDSLAIAGAMMPPGGGATPVLDGLQDVKANYVVNDNGRIGHSFGDTYDTGGHWMLLRPLVLEENVAYLSGLNRYALSFERFPLLLRLRPGRQPVENVSHKRFRAGEAKYRPGTGNLEIVLDDHSILRHEAVPHTNFLIVEVTTRKNGRGEDYAFTWDVTRDYYGIDLSSDQRYFLGSAAETDGSTARLMPGANGLLMHQSGLLLWAERRNDE
ncbi:hypothetical protein [Rhodocaloribacter sp.]